MSIKSRKTVVISLLFAALGCSKQENENEGIPASLDKLETPEEARDAYFPADPVWDELLNKLKIVDIERRKSYVDFVASLGSPSGLLASDTLATETQSTTSKIVGTLENQKCASVGVIDLTSSIAAGLSSKGVTISTGGFKIADDGKTPTNLGDGTKSTKVYLMSYKLGSDTASRYAFLTIPDAAPAAANGAVRTDSDGTEYGYPVALYAHAGVDLSYGEVAKTFADLQLNHITLSPAFPGDNACIAPKDGTTPPACDAADTVATFKNSSTNNGFDSDALDLMGAYECAKQKITSATGFDLINPATGADIGDVSVVTKYAKISSEIATAAGYPNTATQSSWGASAQPLSYIFGFGRGANVAALGLQRAGAVNSSLAASATSLVSYGIVAPQAFSCGMFVGGNYTYAHGRNKLLLERWVKGKSGIISDQTAAKAQLIPGFAKIRANIESLKSANATDAAVAGEAIASYIKTVDSSFAPILLHAGLANFGKLYKAKFLTATGGSGAAATIAAAQGAGLIMNGLNDEVADVSNSTFLYNVSANVDAAIIAAKANTTTDSLDAVGGVNWLGLAIKNTDDYKTETDFGHVTDASFASGVAVVDALKTTTTPSSVVATKPYEGKGPSDVIKDWLTNECIAKAIVADTKE